MDILQEALTMLERHPLCDHCLGRQFALLSHGVENDARGNAIKTVLLLETHAALLSKNEEAVKILKTLVINGFSEAARELLRRTKKRVRVTLTQKTCFLCENKLGSIERFAQKAVDTLAPYEYRNFLVGIELPKTVEEREDEFKAECGVTHGENMRNEFGRLIGKKIAEANRQPVEFLKPDVVVLINPYTDVVRLQVNPLFIAGRYRKLVRGIPQSKWFCSTCRGKGCKKCNGTGKMYPESVEEIIAKTFLDATRGLKSSFHASGREDIDARMLGTGRPFVLEITKPQKRFLDLQRVEKATNEFGKGKIHISNLRFADKDVVRRLKKGENTQKEYRVLIEFENVITDKSIRLIKKLENTLIAQKTPNRVLHRRADMTREKYIYDVNIKKLSPKKAEMRIRCQGGLYVKELVTGDEGRTTPSISEILKNKAKPMKLDVLRVIMED